MLHSNMFWLYLISGILCGILTVDVQREKGEKDNFRLSIFFTLTLILWFPFLMTRLYAYYVFGNTEAGE